MKFSLKQIASIFKYAKILLVIVAAIAFSMTSLKPVEIAQAVTTVIDGSASGTCVATEGRPTTGVWTDDYKIVNIGYNNVYDGKPVNGSDVDLFLRGPATCQQQVCVTPPPPPPPPPPDLDRDLDFIPKVQAAESNQLASNHFDGNGSTCTWQVQSLGVPVIVVMDGTNRVLRTLDLDNMTLTHNQKTGLAFDISGDFTVRSNARVNVSGKGWLGGWGGFSAFCGSSGAQGEGPGGGGYGHGACNNASAGGGAGYGGEGGDGANKKFGCCEGGPPYGSSIFYVGYEYHFGSGGGGGASSTSGNSGGAGGNGGGAFAVMANTITNDGGIFADGNGGNSGSCAWNGGCGGAGGGGSGGSIRLDARSNYVGGAAIFARGGTGPSRGGGPGAGGRVILTAPNLTPASGNGAGPYNTNAVRGTLASDGQPAQDGTYCVNNLASRCMPRTLTVSLGASPNFGPEPLNNVALTATVGGTVGLFGSGPIQYRFDCTDNGNFESNTSVFNNPYTSPVRCNYATFGTYTARVIVNREDLQATGTATVTVQALGGFRGDIYALGQIRGLRVNGPSVVSSGSGTPSITSCGNNVWCVSDYSPRLVSTWKSIMDTNIARLVSERAQSMGNSLSSGSTFNINPTSRLNGDVWRVSGSLTVGGGGANENLPINGVGTIIVDGNLDIRSNISASSPVGLVVRGGNLIIRANVTNLNNVYFYIPDGTVTFENAGTVLTATGTFIAKNFVFPARLMYFTYDTRVALSPPPGFISFILPTVLERAP